MAKAIRVFEVAKDLGVNSKAIVDKCKAEGVPDIINHMSTVKLGLLETIRQWFNVKEEGQSTAIETADKVDLDKVKVRNSRRKRASAVGGDANAVEESSTATATQEPDRTIRRSHAAVEQDIAAAARDVASPATKKEKEVVVAPAPAEAAAQVPPQAAAPTSVAPQAAAPVQPVAPAAEISNVQAMQAMGRPNVPTRPTVVAVGPQLEKPKGAVLRGPKVVRIEQPDKIEAPRPRRQQSDDFRGGGGGGGGSGGGAPRVSPAPRRGGAGVKNPTVDADSDGQPARGGSNKRRSLTTRRGRSAEALPSGPSKFSEQDLLELDARLNRATGFLKQRRRDLRKRENIGQVAQSPVVSGGTVEIAEPITIKELAAATGIKGADIIKSLFKKGVMATINSAIDTEAAMEIALEHDLELVVKEKQSAEQQVVEEFENRPAISVRPRPPVVTVLGHVDHGKTSLLDSIRSADVAAHEAGGITQHIGAYRVTIKGQEGKDKTVVFLDTPGHEAFTSMRARGANMTDVVVLVVAADDGVMPQTIESINHAKAAGVPIIVALNKIDKPEATEDNVRKIYGQMAEHGLNPTEWGGDTEVIRVSALKGKGVTDLLEMLDYQSELLDLKADYGGPARGTVIETQMQPGRGPVARVLVQQGTIKVGDFIVIGRAYGRVRDMTDDRGKMLRDAGPATPLELSGIDMIADAGDKFYVTDTLQKAEQIAKNYREAERQKQLAVQTKVTLDNFADHLAAGNTKELRIVLKADVQGSLDVLRKSLEEVGNKEVAVKVLHSAVGGITESDILLAEASDAVVIGFHVIASPRAKELAEQRHVEIRLYRVIYDVTDEVKRGLEGMLEPERKEEVLGTVEVRQVFHVSKVGMIAGCLVTEGVVQRGAKVRVTRQDVVVTDDRTIETLRRVKDDAKEVRAGTECGIRISGFDDLKIDDKLICYKVTQIKRTLG